MCLWDSEVLGPHLVCSKECFDQVELLREIVVDVGWDESKPPNFGLGQRLFRAVRERI
jgi:hypothetical protein